MDNQNKEQQPAQPDTLRPSAPQTTFRPKSPTPPTPTQPLPQYQESQGPIDLRPKKRSRGKGLLLIILALVLAAAAGWLVYDRFIKDKDAVPIAQSKEIEQIKVGISTADFGKLYPEMAPQQL